MKTALITGVTGQDGSYLAELLVSKGYAVHGIVRRVSQFNRSRVEELRIGGEGKAGKFTLHYGDLQDAGSLRRVIRELAPDEIYHFAGQSHVGLSFEIPEVTCQENAMSTLSLLECIRELDRPVRLYNACSSEVFGRPTQHPQDESTALNPVNPYGAAKAFALQMGRIYREAYGMFVVNGISYNHESPRRGENFVTRKLAIAAAEIAAGRREQVSVGNLDAARDWGYAPEYVEGFWRSLQSDRADDYVFATGSQTTVREFAVAAFAEAGVPLAFDGTGPAETGRRTDTGAVVVTIDPRFFRPLESGTLVGDSRRAFQSLGWKARTSGTNVARALVRAEHAKDSLTSGPVHL